MTGVLTAGSDGAEREGLLLGSTEPVGMFQQRLEGKVGEGSCGRNDVWRSRGGSGASDDLVRRCKRNCKKTGSPSGAVMRERSGNSAGNCVSWKRKIPRPARPSRHEDAAFYRRTPTPSKHVHWLVTRSSYSTSDIMGRNRSSSYAESSDDDFALSDGDKSQTRSRLKRPRRSSTKPPRRLAIRSPQISSFQLDDNDDDVICVPDSLDQDEPKPAQPSHNVESDGAPQDPSAENTMESAAKSEEPAANHESEKEQVASREKEAPGDNGNEQSTRSSRALKQRKTYVISDSESEASAHEDDDAYNSAEDSPEGEDDDVESDFALSPKRVAKKRKTSAPAKRSTPPKKGKALAKSRTTAAKTVSKNTKRSTTVMQSSISKQKKTTATLASGSGKRRLGARIPCNSTALSSTDNSAQKPRRPSLTSFPTPLIRSGLSRKASVPRLHAYLKKN